MAQNKKKIKEEIEEVNPDETLKECNSKIEFPITALVLIGVLIICIVICLIVIFSLENK